MLAQTFRQGHKLLRLVNHGHQQSNLVLTPIKCLSTSASTCRHVGPILPEDVQLPPRTSYKESLLPRDWQVFIQRYPEFLPDPMHNGTFLVHRSIDDMLSRRTVIELPEFYVGSILAVTVSDKYSETKRSKFVGICIERRGQLKKANFTLRNIIDGMGVEIRYDLYNPLLLSIEVLRLEKRLDDTLIYLRDALPEYSKVPEDMRPEPFDDDAEVPINRTLVKMKPQPWSRRWERHLLKGVEKFEDIPEWFAQKVKVVEDNPIYSFDTMLEYRSHCTEEMVYSICKRLADHERDVVIPRREAKSKRFLRVSKKPLITPVDKKN